MKTHLNVGTATVHIFNTGDLMADVRDWLHLSDSDVLTEPTLAQPIPVPVQDVHIALGAASVLVDASHWDYPAGGGNGMPTSYTPPPNLLTQLAQAGINHNAITHVVLTHIHTDHINGLLLDGQLCFPNALHYLGTGESASYTREQQPQIRLLESRGLLRWLDGPLNLADGLDILPAPGETPGHQMLRVQSGGRTLYCVGDVWHHALELTHPEWNVTWADTVTNKNTRQLLLTARHEQQAQFIATHIRGIL